MTVVECEVQLTAHRSAVRLCIPADQSTRLGIRLLPAIVTINGHQVRTTLHKMGGGYMMAVNAELRHSLGVQAGDTVQVTAEPDTAPRTIEVPNDLAAALDTAGKTATFEALTPFRQAEITKSVTRAKRSETRARRIAQTIAELSRTPQQPG
jgi:hypothetical protein